MYFVCPFFLLVTCCCELIRAGLRELRDDRRDADAEDVDHRSNVDDAHAETADEREEIEAREAVRVGL